MKKYKDIWYLILGLLIFTPCLFLFSDNEKDYKTNILGLLYCIFIYEVVKNESYFKNFINWLKDKFVDEDEDEEKTSKEN